MSHKLEDIDFVCTALRSVDLVVPDLAKAVAFYTGIWGLVEVERVDGIVYLRGTGRDAYLVSLREGAAPAVAGIAYRVADTTDLAGLRDRAVAAGARVEDDIAPRPESGGGQGFTLRDLKGRRLLLVQGDRQLEPIVDDAHRPGRLAHVNINCADISSEIAFYEQGLGFQLTDLSNLMGFLRTNGDHHAIVLANETVDTLNHIAFLHDSLESVMKAGGKMCDAGYPVAWGPGRHGPGDNVFLYFIDPFGFVIEHTAEVLLIDDNFRFGGPEEWIWPPGRTDQWGIAPPKGDACKRAQRSIPFT